VKYCYIQGCPFTESIKSFFNLHH